EKTKQTFPPTQNWCYVGTEAEAKKYTCVIRLLKYCELDGNCGSSDSIIYRLIAPTTPAPLHIQANPNPNNGTFRLAANNGVDYMDYAEVKIMDMLGRVQYQADWLAETREIDLENVARGVYILQIRLKDGQQTTTSIVVQ
ncbi:MAG: Secretion system C-terminal sorting domain, partial [Bacteroidota bacterium]